MGKKRRYQWSKIQKYHAHSRSYVFNWNRDRLFIVQSSENQPKPTKRINLIVRSDERLDIVVKLIRYVLENKSSDSTGQID